MDVEGSDLILYVLDSVSTTEESLANSFSPFVLHEKLSLEQP